MRGRVELLLRFWKAVRHLRERMSESDAVPVPSPAALSRQLDPLTYGARHQVLAILGRDHAGSAELEKPLDALNAGDLFAQTCALMIARHAGHVGTIEAALRSDVPDLWAFAVAAMRAVDIPADVVVERCLYGPLRLRRLLVARVRDDHRVDLAEQLLPAVRARYGTRAAAPLLAATTPETVTALLPEFDFALTEWSYLVRWHEAATFEHIAGRLRGVPDSTQEWTRYAKPLARLIRKRPLAVLELCRETLPRSVPNVILDSLGFLARHHPREIVDLLLSDEYGDGLRSSGVPRNLLPAIADLPEVEQERLIVRVGDVSGARGPRGAQLAQFLGRVPPSRRGRLFAAACADIDTSAVVWGTELLAVLPHAVRQDEVRRMLALPQVSQHPQLNSTISSYADVDEIREDLNEAITASDARLRAAAYRNLIVSTGVNRKGLTETLIALLRIKNDQDPVRALALSQMSATFPLLIGPQDVDALSALADAAVEARDVSAASLTALRALALRLLAVNQHAPVQDLALTMLERSSGTDGLAWLGQLDRNLSRRTLDRVLAAVLPQLSAEARRERFAPALSLAAKLDKRGWTSEGLYRLVEEAIGSSATSVASRAAELWLADPEQRDERCTALIRKDSSSALLARSLRHLHRRRQDLLDVVLSGKPLKGKFASGKTTTIPGFVDGFERWLPRQQSAYADLLRRGIADEKQNSQAKAAYVRRLAHLHWLDGDLLRGFASSGDVVVCEAALNGLAHVSRPATSFVGLVGHLNSDRARVAAYSLSPVVGAMDPEVCAREFPGLARSAMRVTARKELLRLAADVRVDGVAAMLADALDHEAPHRDVVIAVAHAARQLADGSERAWDILSRIAEHDSPDVARSFTMASPREFDLTGKKRYGLLLLTVTRHPDLSVRQAAVNALPAWAEGIEDELASRFGELILDPGAVGEWRGSVGALMSVNLRGIVSERIVGVAESLLAATSAEDVTAGGDRDIPMRQRLRAVLQAIRDRQDPRDDSADSLRRAASTVLDGVTDLAMERVALVLMAVDWRQPTEVRRVIHSAAAFAGASGDVSSLMGGVVEKSLERSEQRWAPADLVSLAQSLLGDEPPSSRVAVTITNVAGRRAGWPAEWCDILTAARKSEDQDVQAAALRVTVRSE